jgi:response regulator RpfG family c-di-GMP phosphodiesterase
MRVLIVDDDIDILGMTRLFLEGTFQAEVIEARSASQAIEILLASPRFDLVVSDYQMVDDTGADLLKSMRENGLSIPFVLASTSAPTEHAAFTTNPPDAFVLKPMVHSALKKLLFAWIQSGKIASHLPATTLPYCRVRVSTVLRLAVPEADLYVKLSDSKYVRIFRRGEAIVEADLGRYSLKAVDYLYVQGQDLQAFLDFFEQDLMRFYTMAKELGASGLPISAFAVQLIYDIFQQLRLGPNLVRMLQTSVQACVENLKKSPSIHAHLDQLRFAKELYLADHSAAVAYTAAAFAMKARPRLQCDVQAQAYAGLLHDLTLKSERLAKVRTLDEVQNSVEFSRFSYDELTTYKEHPNSAAELVRSIPGVSPLVAGTVAAHHELPTGLGFPKGLKEGEMSVDAVLFQLAHDYVWECFEKGSRVDFADFCARARRQVVSPTREKILAAVQDEGV